MIAKYLPLVLLSAPRGSERALAVTLTCDSTNLAGVSQAEFRLLHQDHSLLTCIGTGSPCLHQCHRKCYAVSLARLCCIIPYGVFSGK